MADNSGAARALVESDGGPTDIGPYVSHQRRTYYVVIPGLCRSRSFRTRREARALADKLNREVFDVVGR